jgi:peroxiredoxin
LIFGISTDPGDQQIDFARSLSLSFPLVPDVGRQLSILLGTATNPTQTTARASIFIDKNGVVRLIDRKVDPSSHGQDLLRRLRELGVLR